MLKYDLYSELTFRFLQQQPAVTLFENQRLKPVVQEMRLTYFYMYFRDHLQPLCIRVVVQASSFVSGCLMVVSLVFELEIEYHFEEVEVYLDLIYFDYNFQMLDWYYSREEIAINE